jgi:hypothetical protein
MSLKNAIENSKHIKLIPARPGHGRVIFLGNKEHADAVREQLRPKEKSA